MRSDVRNRIFVLFTTVHVLTHFHRRQHEIRGPIELRLTRFRRSLNFFVPIAVVFHESVIFGHYSMIFDFFTICPSDDSEHNVTIHIHVKSKALSTRRCYGRIRIRLPSVSSNFSYSPGFFFRCGTFIEKRGFAPCERLTSSFLWFFGFCPF